MRKTKLKPLLLWVTFVIFLLKITSGVSSPLLKVVICSVGQGDAIYLEYNAWSALIDTGPDDKVLKCLERHRSFGLPILNLMVLTHWDADHIGGSVYVLNKYKVEQIISPTTRSSTALGKSLLQFIQDKKIPTLEFYAGDQVWVDRLKITAVWPQEKILKSLVKNTSPVTENPEKQSTNDQSMVLSVEIGDFSALFTGDLESEQEAILVDQEKIDRTTLLKLGHHGSAGSSSDLFLKNLDPALAVASVGLDNSYGHPAEEVVERILNLDIDFLRTDRDGDVVVFTDGSQAWYHTSMDFQGSPEQTIEAVIRSALEDLDIATEVFERLLPSTITRPSEKGRGDFTSTVALVLSSALKTNPTELGNKVAQIISQKKIDDIAKVEFIKPGFLNFELSKKYHFQRLQSIIDKPETYGQKPQKNKKILVEFSSPNIAKPFTIGHFRSTIIGESVARILTASGYDVIRDNHLGDWGTQFGKQISAMKRWGDETLILQSDSPVKMLVELYVRFHDEAEKDPSLEDEARAWFLKLEQGDLEARRLWQFCIDISMNEFQRLYARLGISFDTQLGESFFEPYLKQVLADVEASPYGRESNGALLMFFEDAPDKKMATLPPLMVRRSDGATLYAARDIAADWYRVQQYGEDIKIINEVGSEQNLYFQQVYAAEELLGYIPRSQRYHLGHGMIRFKDRKMSTRKGDVIWLDDLLDEAVVQASKINPSVAEQVAISALKYNDLRREAKNDIQFSWDEMLTLKGNSGPYLQYTAARAFSALQKAKQAGIEPNSSLSFTPAIEQEIGTIEPLLERYPEIVERAAEEYAPHHLCTYLFELAQAFNAYYANKRIVGEEQSPYRVNVTAATHAVLCSGMQLLGMTPLTVM